MPRIRTHLPCAAADCDRVVIARGLCKMHWKRLYASPPKVHQTECAGCGVTVARQRPTRFTFVFCSELCRHWIQWGAWSRELPKTHPARPQHERVAKPPMIRVPKVRSHAFECEWCGASSASHQSIARFCSETCGKRSSRARRRARVHGAIGTYTWTEIVRLWLTFDRSCAYCLRPTPLIDIQAEHVQPISKGGANNLTNLLVSCALCNSDKSDHSLTDWAASRTKRGLPPVRTTWHPTDPRFIHLSFVASAPLIDQAA